jgi:hypothetical protein
MATLDSYKLVLVEWEDSAQPIARWVWLDDHTWDGIVRCRSVGWLVHDGEDVKALAPNVGDIDGDGVQASAIIRIPARCVTRMIEVAELANCEGVSDEDEIHD